MASLVEQLMESTPPLLSLMDLTFLERLPCIEMASYFFRELWTIGRKLLPALGPLTLILLRFLEMLLLQCTKQQGVVQATNQEFNLKMKVLTLEHKGQ